MEEGGLLPQAPTRLGAAAMGTMAGVSSLEISRGALPRVAGLEHRILRRGNSLSWFASWSWIRTETGGLQFDNRGGNVVALATTYTDIVQTRRWVIQEIAYLEGLPLGNRETKIGT